VISNLRLPAWRESSSNQTLTILNPIASACLPDRFPGSPDEIGILAKSFIIESLYRIYQKVESNLRAAANILRIQRIIGFTAQPCVVGTPLRLCLFYDDDPILIFEADITDVNDR
jgi:hypothetical protein